MAFAAMSHDVDPRTTITDALGDVDGIELFSNQVLVAVYIRPEKTKSGIFLTSQTLGEDKFQGKVGMIVRMGPEAFRSEGDWNFPDSIAAGDWIVMRPSDGWSITVNGVLCRILSDTSVKGRISSPDQVW
jgi:co-chaperonin GroES (HSP10)